jgi:hypothetical protein
MSERRTFGTAVEQRTYDLFMRDDRPTRGDICDNFKRGRLGIMRPAGPSPALAAWLAGKDCGAPK